MPHTLNFTPKIIVYLLTDGDVCSKIAVHKKNKCSYSVLMQGCRYEEEKL